MMIEDVFEHDELFVQVSEFVDEGGYGISVWTTPEGLGHEIFYKDLPKKVRSRLRNRGLPAGKRQPYFKSKNDAVRVAKDLAKVLVQEGLAPDVTVLVEDREEVTYVIAPPFNVQTEKR